MRSAVTNRQIFLILLLTITAYSAISLPKDAVKAVGTGAGFTMLLLTIIFSIGIFFISSLNKIFIGKTIFEYSKIIVGKQFGFIINVFYFLYFSTVTTCLVRAVAEFLNETYLPLTPIWVLFLLIVIPCSYIAYKGITNIGRLCEIFGVILIFVTIIIFGSAFYLGDIEYCKPIFEFGNLKEYVFGMKDLMFAFLGIEVLTIIPFGKDNIKKGVSSSVISVFFTGLLYIYVVYASITTIGINTIKYYQNALIEALREIHLPSTFLLERADILYITVGVSGIICCLSVVIFATLEFTSKFFVKINRDILFLIMGIIFFIIGNFVIDYEIAESLFKVLLPIMGLFTAFIIPITLFTIAKGKKYEN